MKWNSPKKPPEEYTEVLLRRDRGEQQKPIIESGWYAAPALHGDGSTAFPESWTSTLSMEYDRWNEVAGYFNGTPKELPPVSGWLPLPDKIDGSKSTT